MSVFKQTAAPKAQPNTSKFTSYATGYDERAQQPRDPGAPKETPPRPMPEPGLDADKFPKGGERVVQSEYVNTTYDPGDHVPDMPVRSVTGTKVQGQSPSFEGTLAFPPPPPVAHKPFKVK